MTAIGNATSFASHITTEGAVNKYLMRGTKTPMFDSSVMQGMKQCHRALMVQTTVCTVFTCPSVKILNIHASAVPYLKILHLINVLLTELATLQLLTLGGSSSKQVMSCVVYTHLWSHFNKARQLDIASFTILEKVQKTAVGHQLGDDIDGLLDKNEETRLVDERRTISWEWTEV